MSTAQSKIPQAEDVMNAWRKMMDEQTTRLQSLTQEMSRVEKQGVAQAQTAIDEWARMLKDSLNTVSQINAEWRTLAMESTRKANEMARNLMAN